MSPNHPSPHPTRAELAILRVLWSQGPATVRQVFEALQEQREVGYTTVLKLMQIMTEKGFVERDVSQRSHVYRACLSESKAQRGLVGDLLDRAFEGSTSKLIMQALSSKPTDPDELKRIRSFLDELQSETD